jgi:hypothetical protein
MKIVYKIIIVFLAGILIPVFLLFTIEVPNSKKNGFKRKILYSIPESVHSKKLNKDYFNICGTFSKYFFLSSKQPDQITLMDTTLNEMRDIHLQIQPFWINAINNIFHTSIEYPTVYIYAGNVPMILKTSLRNQDFSITEIPKPGFTRAVHINGETFMLRKLSADYKNQLFYKYSTIESESGLGTVTNDGGISSDGQLHFDSTTNQLVYVHFYDNTFITFDSNLSLIKKYHTIDTVSENKIAIEEVRQKDQTALTSKVPLHLINETSCVNNGLLFVYSSLRADNETKQDFANNLPIDIYNLKSGSYYGSIYLPISYSKRNIKRIKVFHDKLIVLFPRHISIYKVRI